jgi:hypothetical protein
LEALSARIFTIGRTVFMLAALSACTINNTGLLAAHVTEADRATVIDIYSLGAQLTTASYDRSASLGYDVRSYVFPDTVAGLPSAGWHFFHTQLPTTPPVAVHTRTFGVAASARAGEVSGMIGYEEVAVMASVPAGDSISYKLTYAPDDPTKTSLSDCTGVAGC